MATAPLDKLKDARYHAIKATEEWANFVNAEMANATNSPVARAARDAQRQRETTYSRGQLGGH
jgi:hypothetical protein